MGEENDEDVEERCNLKTFGAATCVCLAVVIVIGLLGVGITKVVMGAIYSRDCSIQNLIPIWLIVSGCAPVLYCGLCTQNNEERGRGSNLCGAICGVVGFLLNLAWLICGSVWVYPNYGKVTANDFTPCTANITMDCTTGGDCNEILITFAFAMATLDWICMGIWIALIIGLIVMGIR